MADLTPEQLERLERLATARDDINSRMDAYIAAIGTDAEDEAESFAMDGDMLRAVSLEFMDSATALVEAAKELARLREALRRLVADVEVNRVHADVIQEVLDGRAN